MGKYKLSRLAEELSTSSISNLSEKIDEKNKAGEKTFNCTLGDFCPENFPIPHELEEEIIKAYRKKNTNYPFVGGMKELRTAISSHIKEHGNFSYKPNEVIVASGARPLIYLLFKVLLDPGDKVIYTAPTWNTQHFIHLADANQIVIQAKPENDFMISSKEIIPHIKEATLITINSPLNPSGTVLKQDEMKKIFNLVAEENKTRIKNNKKPLYIFFDIIYWLVTYNENKGYSDLMLDPKIRDYVIFIDGMSKCFAATGVRVGWAFGPQTIIDKMRSILSHLGAWTPKPEQVGTAKYLKNRTAVSSFLNRFKEEVLTRLNIFYETIKKLKSQGYKVDAIAPQGAIYLSIKFDLVGSKTPDGKILKSVSEASDYLLDKAKLGIVPFYYFGMDESLPWFRLSVGTCSIEDAKLACRYIEDAIKKLDQSPNPDQ